MDGYDGLAFAAEQAGAGFDRDPIARAGCAVDPLDSSRAGTSESGHSSRWRHQPLRDSRPG